MRSSLPVIILCGGILVGIGVLVFVADRGDEDVTTEAPVNDARQPVNRQAAQERMPMSVPGGAAGGVGTVPENDKSVDNTRVDPTGLGPHYPDPRRNTPEGTSMPIEEAQARWLEAGMELPGTNPSIDPPRPEGAVGPGEYRAPGGGVTALGGPDASQAPEAGMPPLGESGPVGLPPEAGDSGIVGPAPEASDPGVPMLPPEAGDPGIAGPAPEDSDPGIRYPSPEESGG